MTGPCLFVTIGAANRANMTYVRQRDLFSAKLTLDIPLRQAEKAPSYKGPLLLWKFVAKSSANVACVIHHPETTPHPKYL